MTEAITKKIPSEYIGRAIAAIKSAKDILNEIPSDLDVCEGKLIEKLTEVQNLLDARKDLLSWQGC